MQGTPERALGGHTSNIQQEVERLKAASIEVTAPEPGGRKKIDGTTLRWQTATAGPALRSLLPFMIQDEPTGLRVPPSRTIPEIGLTASELSCSESRTGRARSHGSEKHMAGSPESRA